MKAFILMSVALFSINAMADQCQAINYDEAQRAALLLQKNATVTDFCEPCMEGIRREGNTYTVNKVKVEAVKLLGSTYYEVKVNDKSIDLAYTFVQVAPNRSVNVAKAIACSTLDESTVSSVIDLNLKTIK